MRWRRTATVLGWAFAFGVLAAVIKGQSGDGSTLVSRVRFELGNLSVPWVLVAWFAGARAVGIGRGAVLGLAATLVALVGFYVVSGVVEPMGGSSAIEDVSSWIAANRVYFEAGVISGPLFGAFGAWCAKRGSPGTSLVVGLLLVGEPLVLWLVGAIFPNGVLSPLTGLPLVVRIVPGFGLSGVDTVSIVVHATELALGLGVVAATLVARRRRRAALAAL